MTRIKRCQNEVIADGSEDADVNLRRTERALVALAVLIFLVFVGAVIMLLWLSSQSIIPSTG